MKDVDCYLSGVSLTMVIKKGSLIYCANVGNVLAFIFFSEKIFSYKFEVRQLSFDDSNFSLNSVGEISNFNLMAQISNSSQNINRGGYESADKSKFLIFIIK